MRPRGRRLSQVYGEILFQDVYFRYPSRKEAQIFNGVSIRIAAGNTTALVGESGSGKSTIISLIERFYDVDRGAVTLDGVNVKELDMKWFRSKIALVAQEPVLLSATLRANVSFGMPNQKPVSDEQIWCALQTADAETFVRDLPDGLDTYVGGSIATLSGGQKQRVAIARAVIGNPDILLLDEATASLDANGERRVQAAIDRLIRERQRTTVVVAHRLSTIRNADNIMVFDRGMLIEEGNHDELMENRGTYSALVALSDGNGDTQLNNQAHEDAAEGQQQYLAKVSLADPESTTKQHIGQWNDVGPIAPSLTRDASATKPNNGTDDEVEEKRPQFSEETEAETEAKTEIHDGSMPQGSFRRLLRYTLPEKRYFIPAIVGAAVNGVAVPVFALIFAQVVSIFFATSATVMKELASLWSIGFFVIAIVIGIATVAQYYYFGIIGFRMISRVRAQLFSRIVRSETAFFDEKQNSTGSLTAVLSTDAANLRAVATERPAMIVRNVCTIIAGCLIAFLASWKLTLIVFSLVPLIIFGAAIDLWIATGFADENAVNASEAGHLLTEAIMGIRTVVSLSLRPKIIQIYSRLLQDPMKKAVREGLVAGIAFGFSQFTRFIGYALAFGVGGRMFQNGELTFEQLTQSFFGILLTALTLGESSAMMPDIAKGKSAVKSVFRMLDRKSSIDPLDDEFGKKPSNLLGDVGFNHVHFAYPSRPDAKVFKGFSLDLKRGETVAIVGQSGSGKSTAIALAQRLYDCDQGSVTIDGHDVRELNVSWLRSNTGIVSQEPSLFAGTIAENIAIGKHGKEVTQEELEQAAKLANAYDFIVDFPDGFQTPLTGQLSVSGGQKQRICIARALVARPNILLLDEATSALDNTSQAVVQDALDSVMKEAHCTTIIVAHRLDSVRNATRIFVVEKGVITESGNHESLLRNPDGAYSKLFAAQLENGS